MHKSSNKGKTDNLKQRLIKGVAGSFGLKIAATGLAFVTSVVLARLLGSEGLGVYSYIFAWISLLGIPATLGLDKLFVREIAIYQAKGEWGLMRGLLRWANLIVFVVAVSLAVTAAIIFRSIGSGSIIAFAIASLTLPLISLGNLRLGAMKGLRRVVLGTLPEMLISPVLFIALLGCGYLWWGKDLNVSMVLGIKVAVSLVIFILGTIWLDRLLPNNAKQAQAQYQVSKWVRSALPLMFLGSMQLINTKTDVLMLGAISGTEAVGIYVVVRQATQLIIFLQSAANSVLAPNIASLYAQRKMQQLQRVITKSSCLVFLVSLFIAVSLIFLSSWLLPLFGSDFIAGRNALIILSIGQIINTSMGPVGNLLTMTGHENYTAITVGSSAVLNVFLNALLIPQWGINGAAIATASSIILVNVVNMFLVKKKLKISSTAWSILVS